MDKMLLSMLVCPISKAPLVFDPEKMKLVCSGSGLASPIRDGVPIMLESEARFITADEKLAKMEY